MANNLTDLIAEIRARVEAADEFEHENKDDSDLENNADTNGYFPPRPSQRSFEDYQEIVEGYPADITRLLAALELCIKQRDLYRNDWATGDGKPCQGEGDNAALAAVLRGEHG